jgi:hypothetical protein
VSLVVDSSAVAGGGGGGDDPLTLVLRQRGGALAVLRQITLQGSFLMLSSSLFAVSVSSLVGIAAKMSAGSAR